MSNRVVRFEYYQVCYREDEDQGRDRLFDLSQWMLVANRLSLEARTFDYKSEQARLETGYWDPEINYYFLHFSRLRDRNIPNKARTNEEVIPIELEDDEFIGETVSALYDEDVHVLMLQRNRHSLGPEGIEEYLNLVWNNDHQTIYLRPISPPNAFEQVRNGEEYRRINLRFADLNIIPERNLRTLLRSPLGNIVNAFREFDSINAQVVITAGTQRDNGLNHQTITDTLNLIEENEDIFSKAEIAFKPDDDTKVELIDLFTHKAHDFATFRMQARESLNHVRVAEEMGIIYSAADGCRNRRADVIGYLRQP